MALLARNRTFGLLWLGFTLSELGTRVHYLAIPIIAFRLTGSALGVGSCFMAISLSMAFVGPMAGVFIDRVDRGRLLTASALLAAAVTTIISTTRTFPIYLCLEFVLNILLTFYYPLFATSIPEIVHPEQLPEANSIMAVSTRMSQLIGPALGALLLLRWDTGITAN